MWKSRNESWETSDKRQILRGPKWHRQKSERQRQVNYPVNSCGPPHKRLLHSWMCVTALNQLLDGCLKRSSRSPDATASCLHVNFLDCCPQPISSESFFLGACAPILALCPFHLFLYSQCKFFQNNFRVSSPKRKSHPLQDKRHVFSIEASSDCVPQDLVPFLAGMWLKKPFLSGKLSAAKGFNTAYETKSCSCPLLPQSIQLTRTRAHPQGRRLGLEQAPGSEASRGSRAWALGCHRVPCKGWGGISCHRHSPPAGHQCQRTWARAKTTKGHSHHRQHFLFHL